MNAEQVKTYIDHSYPIVLLEKEGGMNTIRAIIKYSSIDPSPFMVALNAYTIGRIVGIQLERKRRKQNGQTIRSSTWPDGGK